MNFRKNIASKQGGFLKMLIIFIVVIIVLSALNIDIKSIVESEQAQSNFSYVWNFAKLIWNDYLSDPVTYFWNNIFISLLWTSFMDNMERIKGGESTEMMLNAPRVDFVQ